MIWITAISRGHSSLKPALTIPIASESSIAPTVMIQLWAAVKKKVSE